MDLIAKKIFFTKGVGIHKEYLQSFELALRDAKIEKQNLVTVSSILPPHCEIISLEEGVSLLEPGSLTFCVMARNATNELNRLIAASVGLAVPADRSHYGYISEHHPFGQSEQYSGDYAEDLAAQMLATTIGVPFNADSDWSDREQIYRMSDKILETKNITACAHPTVSGTWVSVVACAVFVF